MTAEQLIWRLQLALAEGYPDEPAENEAPCHPPPRPEVLPDNWFIVGDIVSRDGTDEQLVIQTNEESYPGYPPDLITVRCIKAPSTPWCAIGEEEENLPRRYSLVRRASGTVSRLNG